VAATARNRLARETSPYLLQHADNPVDWYPWGEEALARARAEDRPILLSIGYSACHWCHVMAHESFEDPETARVMNDLFVNIKVDREERPDLDRIYQTAHQLLTGRPGGWPLTVFLTPDDLVPFFAGTYFPPEPRHGLPAFRDLLRRVAGFYRSHREEIRAQNTRFLAALRSLEPEPAPSGRALDAAPLEVARRQIERDYDPSHGGFGPAPKFPHPTHLVRLLRHWAASAAHGEPDARALQMLTHTLDAMARGGLYDQLGGGFYRYSVDARWEIPHFEKMLYDNGQLLAVYADVWAATGRPLYRRVAEETAAFLLQEMCAPEGGFAAALDADSEGGEGAWYVWTREAVHEALGDEALWPVAEAAFGLDGPPNFEGRWHLVLRRGPEALARHLGLDAREAARRLEAVRERLLAARGRRPRPGRDDKVIAAWNALAIQGLARAARHLDREDLAAAACEALDFIRARLWRDGRLLAVWKDGRARFPAYLDDHAFLLAAVLELMAVRFRREDLDFATALADRLLEGFEDREAGGFRFTATDHERLIHRPRPFADDAIPAGNGVAAWALQRLGHLTGEARYLAAAERTLRAGWGLLEQSPYACGSLLDALEERLWPPQLVVVHAPAAALPAWEAALRGYAPRRLAVRIPLEAADDLPGPMAAPAAARPDGAAHVCTGTHCLPPARSPEALAGLLAREAAAAAAPPPPDP